MIAIDLKDVLVLLLKKSMVLKKENAQDLENISLGTIMQHLYCVIVFGMMKQSFPIDYYTGIGILDQLKLQDILEAGEYRWFLTRTLPHTLLQDYEIRGCIIVGQHGVISYESSNSDDQ